MNRIKEQFLVSVVRELPEISSLQTEWNELHSHCSYPTIYNSFDYVMSATEVFDDNEDQRFFVLLRDVKTQKLIAIFPLKLTKFKWHRLKFRAIVFAGLHEADKPYPIIQNDLEYLVWQEFKKFILTTDEKWQFLELVEVSQNVMASEFIKTEFKLPKFIHRSLPDAISPLIDLQKPWDDFWNEHPKMRKKVRKMEKDFASSFKFEVFSEQQNALQHLAEYFELESRSRKLVDNIGISRSPTYVKFYETFFTRLAASNALYFGFLYCENKLVSAEIAYVSGTKVYFSHGCFDSNYANYSPGMVSTSLFLQYFHNSSFLQGDFLGGFAHYINPWADRLIHSTHETVCKLSVKVLVAHTLGQIAKLMKLPFKKNSNQQTAAANQNANKNDSA